MNKSNFKILWMREKLKKRNLNLPFVGSPQVFETQTVLASIFEFLKLHVWWDNFEKTTFPPIPPPTIFLSFSLLNWFRKLNYRLLFFVKKVFQEKLLSRNYLWNLKSYFRQENSNLWGFKFQRKFLCWKKKFQKSNFKWPKFYLFFYRHFWSRNNHHRDLNWLI